VVAGAAIITEGGDDAGEPGNGICRNEEGTKVSASYGSVDLEPTRLVVREIDTHDRPKCYEKGSFKVVPQ